MELNSIESHMEKVVQYLEELSTTDKKLYTKTRTRLGDLNTQLCHSVELISQILADNILKQDTEFGENLGEIETEVNSMNKNISSAMNQVTRLNTFIEPSANINVKKTILRTYRDTIRETALSKISYDHVLKCARLIDKWFESRFYLSLPHDPGFKYKIEMLPHWIADIIILYGYCIDTDNFSDIEEFNIWCTNISSGVITTSYAIPFCIYKVSHNMTKDYVTFSGLGLYDLLLDAGFSKLSSPDLHGVVCSPYMIQDRFRAYNSEIVDEYTYCGNDESLMRRYKLIGG